MTEQRDLKALGARRLIFDAKRISA